MIITLQTLIFFRQSLITVIERFLRPYYRKLSLKFRGDEISDDEDSDDHVFADYDDKKGVVFYPPVYAQRYAAVTDCLMDDRWCGKLEKVVDFGYHDMSFIKYLKDVPGIEDILGVDIETIPLRCSSDLLGCENYIPKRETPLNVILFQGNAADPDYRLIGCDAVIAIEMIEHMLPHDLERLIHTIFGFIKPWVTIFTTPNGDFNVLFKALEKNGLRRLDHMFEWSREQFHDWCSNIVARYPDFTVTCKGIGPGPPGTLHLGSCSQLALFVAKDYQKQPDLKLNSMALVTNVPSPNNLSEMVGTWESPDTLMENNMICLPNSTESYTDLVFDQQSCMTIVLTSPSFSLESITYKDEILQCNLELEKGKNFLMFDEELHYNILWPRKEKHYRVYEIEDVTSRLNCSTLQVKKFSKTTQNLMAKNKLDSFVHTREVVDEIRHLTKMLNFNRDDTQDLKSSTWCNINWGVNAPYWNQYYRIVREYNYPFEIKSDECRILDIITEEINRLIDSEYDEEFAVDTHKLEIPIEHLMRVVEHITDDVDKVKELLEWNGYEIVDDLLIHSRLVVDNISESTQEENWQDDTVSDWDTTDVRSTTLSDGSTIVPDFYGQFLRRALEQKIRKLRKILNAEEDVTTELDRVVCRLMKLALCTSKGRQNPPPSSWMQCKLFDLLTLTEKAIDRRRQLMVLKYPMKAIEYCKSVGDSKDVSFENTARDLKAERIMTQYKQFDPMSDNRDEVSLNTERFADSELGDFISVTSDEFRDYETNNLKCVNNKHKDLLCDNVNLHVIEGETNVGKENDIHEDNFIYPNKAGKYDTNSSDESISNINIVENELVSNTRNVAQQFYKVSNSKLLPRKDSRNISKSLSKSKIDSKHSIHKTKRTNVVRKVSSKKSSYINFIKYDCVEYKQYKNKSMRKSREYSNLNSTSRPIPGSLLELCCAQSDVKNMDRLDLNIPDNIYQFNDTIAATENSLFIGIVTEEGEETIAMRRHIGTDPELELGISENEALLETVINITKEDSFYYKPSIETETFQSQTIFLNDLNEPSTSKGVRHLSTDVQCGSDVILTRDMLSATTSITKMPNLFDNDIRIGAPNTGITTNKTTYDFGTYTGYNDKILTVSGKSVGIKIKDSDTCIYGKTACFTMTQELKNKNVSPLSELLNFDSRTETIKPVSSALKIEDSGSELCGSVESYVKSQAPFVTSSVNTSDFQIQSISNEKNVVAKVSQVSYCGPKLACGGIHVHSFKEKQGSEDVVYQGEWQRRQNSQRNNVYCPKKCGLLLKKIKKDVKCAEVHDVKKFAKKITTKPRTKFNGNKQKTEIKTEQSKRKYTPHTFNMNKKTTVKVSKIAVSTHIPKNTKTIYTTKKLVSVINKELPKKNNNNEDPKKRSLKNYLPLYLRRRRQYSDANKGNKVNLKSKTMITDDAKNMLVYNTNEITKDLLKTTETHHMNNHYMIFRNEIETGNSSNVDQQFTAGVKNDDVKKHIQSPESQNSSTCSSPNSVATVRAVSTRNKVISNRRTSISAEMSNSEVLESEKKSSKNKKYSRRVKSTKKLATCDNKENVPESSTKSLKNVDRDRKNIEKSTERAQSVFMAQMITEKSSLALPSTTISKSKTISLNEANPLTNIYNNNTETRKPTSLSIFQKELVNNKSVLNYSESNDAKSLNIEDDVITVEPNTKYCIYQNVESNTSINNDPDEPLKSPQKSLHKTKSSIISAIRVLIENKLNLDENKSFDSDNSDSETIILGRDDIYVNNCNDSASPISSQHVSTNEDASASESDAEHLVNDSFDTVNKSGVINNSTNIKLPDNESDLISLKSFASTSTSKFSEYYLADNELDNTSPHADTTKISSIQDLFERKDQNIAPVVGGIPIQSFSGFSVNEPIIGDQPNFINFVDSETGSFAFESTRQAASEEIFVSGRSSDTYESCYVDDDAYVPNWLFNIISQQQSAEESEAEEVNMPVQMGEPSFDVNGNMMEPGVGVGAGAGDGRGMHSDQSQDSSGHGTSLSSSEVSSEHQSEAILIDPSIFTSPVGVLRDSSVNMSLIGSSDSHSDTLSHIAEDDVSENANNSRSINARNLTNAARVVSDFDADVSSLDTTDANDSDD